MRRHIPLYSTAIMERSLSCRSLHLHHDASAHLRVAEHELVGILHLCRDKRIAIQHHAFRESVLPEVEPFRHIRIRGVLGIGDRNEHVEIGIFVYRYETPAKAQQENRQTATADRQNRLFISDSSGQIPF